MQSQSRKFGVDFNSEEFKRVVSTSATLGAICRHYGKSQAGYSYKKFNDKIKELKLDTRHFNAHQKGPTKNFMSDVSDEKFKQIVAKSQTKVDICKALGVRSGGHYNSYIGRRIKQLGLSTDHFSIPVARAGYSPVTKRSAADLLTIWPLRVRSQRNNLVARAMKERGILYICAECGNSGEWRGRELKLGIQYKNGDWRDNRLENLCFLCPNCKYQEKYVRESSLTAKTGRS